MGIVEEVGQRGHGPQARRPGRDPVQHLLRPLLDVRAAACSRSARPPRSASRARARRCSATPSSTARCRAGRPSTCACRRRSTARSRCPEGPAGRPVRLPLRRAADRVAGGRVRRRSREGGSVAVLGLGPIGDMAARIARAPRRSAVIGVDLVPERLERARDATASRSSTCASTTTSSATRSGELTDGRGTDAVIDAVGMEAHGSPVGKLAQDDGRPAARRGRRSDDGEGRRRPARGAATLAIDIVRRGGTISISRRLRRRRPTRCRC